MSNLTSEAAKEWSLSISKDKDFDESWKKELRAIGAKYLRMEDFIKDVSEVNNDSFEDPKDMYDELGDLSEMAKEVLDFDPLSPSKR